MAFDTVADFLAMGGYGLYVWISYALTLLCVGFMLLPPLFLRGGLLREQRQQERRSQRQPRNLQGE